MKKTEVSEVNGFYVVWNNLLSLGGDNFKLKKIDKLAKILSSEHLSQNRNKRLFDLADKFEPSISFSKSTTFFFRIAWTCIDQKRSETVRKMFNLYKKHFSPEAVEFVLKSYFSLTPFIGIGLDADTPRLKIYAYLRNYKQKGVTADDVVNTVESLCRFFHIDIRESISKNAFFVTMCIDFYFGEKYSVKVYQQFHESVLEEELVELIPGFKYTKSLIAESTGNSICLSFSDNPKPDKTVYLRFYKYPSNFDFKSILESLGFVDRMPLLAQFIKANSINSFPVISFLGFGQDKFTVYLHPGL